MSYHDEVIKILEEAQDVDDAASIIYKGPKRTALYVLVVGLETFKARKRRRRRRELRQEIKPQFAEGRGGAVVFTPKTKKNLFQAAQDLFGDDGWQIGDLNLGDFTKEALLAQAVAEDNSAAGSIRNATFYRALAEPLQSGQFVREYWNPTTARSLRRSIVENSANQSPDPV